MKSKKQVQLFQRRSLWQRIWDMRIYYLLLLPFLAFIFIFKYMPMYGILLAFKDFKIRKGIWGSPWAGLKYFNQLFSSFSFYEVLRNTIVISLEKLIFCFPIPIILAIFINEIRSTRVKKIFQTCSYLPYFISWVVAASFIQDIFALDGPVNQIINLMGGDSIYFMADSRYFRGLLVITNIWKGCGWGSIIYLAAIAGISPELYEAAEIDGASKLQSIWHVTLPGMRTIIVTMFILDVGKLMYAGFDQVYNLYNSSVYSVADIIDTYTYRQGLVNFNYSYATAAGLFQNVVGFIMVVLSNFIVKRIDSEVALW